MIVAACDPTYYEPNLLLNMDIVDYINQKQKAHPRHAAFAIVKLVNDRNPNTASLALNLLDHCVKNCRYPFHLIIASKEFLNELVRKFPERPAFQGVGPVQSRILELLQQWNATLCRHSRYKDDFKNIADMYNLLLYKGYRFPKLAPDAASVLAPQDHLQTELELEEEDNLAHAAKLQELLRLGSPAALEQANDLMKIMAGYDLDKRPDYKSQVNEELDKIQHRAMVLNDVLNSKSPQDRLMNDPNLDELYASAKTAQARIQKLISENDQEDRIARLLELNDLINAVLTKYLDYKAGKPITRELPGFQINQSPRTGPISLIDFDSVPSSAAPPSLHSPPAKSAANPQNLLDDLNGLNFSDEPFPLPNPPNNSAILANFSFPNTSMVQTASPSLGNKPFANFNNNSTSNNNNNNTLLDGLTIIPPSATPLASSLFSTTSPPLALGNTSALSGRLSPSPPAPSTAPSSIDPFDSLGPALTNQASPSTPYIPPKAPSSTASPSSLTDFSAFTTSAPAPQHAAGAQDAVLLQKNGLRIVMRCVPSPAGWSCHVSFSNTTPVPFENLVFAVAVPKTMSLAMDALSSQSVPPLGTRASFQALAISNPAKEQLRMRFKVSYEVNSIPVEEQGEYTHKP
ncbi:hypothetical protein SeMB42_g04242 [Synchytrium endobioticum]|nr:hypothetical protein SeMB42_g04242 [Synchytrium endobioticum]